MTAAVFSPSVLRGEERLSLRDTVRKEPGLWGTALFLRDGVDTTTRGGRRQEPDQGQEGGGRRTEKTQPRFLKEGREGSGGKGRRKEERGEERNGGEVRKKERKGEKREKKEMHPKVFEVESRWTVVREGRGHPGGTGQGGRGVGSPEGAACCPGRGRGTRREKQRPLTRRVPQALCPQQQWPLKVCMSGADMTSWSDAKEAALATLHQGPIRGG